jgi:ATP-dependent Lon protease
LLVGSLDIDYEKKQSVLECLELESRVEKTVEYTRDVIDTVKVASQINKDVADKMTSKHREYILRQQLQAIKEQLGTCTALLRTF